MLLGIAAANAFQHPALPLGGQAKLVIPGLGPRAAARRAPRGVQVAMRALGAERLPVSPAEPWPTYYDCAPADVPVLGGAAAPARKLNPAKKGAARRTARVRRQRAPRSSSGGGSERVGRELERRTMRGQHALESQALDVQLTLALARDHLAATVPDPTPACPKDRSIAMTLGSVFGLAALLVFTMPFVLGLPFIHMLVAHGLAGAFGGLAALCGDAALSASLDKPQLPYWRWREKNCVRTWLQGSVRRWKKNLKEHCFVRMATARSVNAMTFAYVKQLAVLVVGAGVQAVVVAAAVTGVVATAVQTALCQQQETLFQAHVLSNMLMFEGFWLTYATLCSLLPVCGISYCGLALSGALCGLVMSLASADPGEGAGRREEVGAQSSEVAPALLKVKTGVLETYLWDGYSLAPTKGRLQAAWERLRRFSKREAILGYKFRMAFQMAILNVVYMAVFWTLQ